MVKSSGPESGSPSLQFQWEEALQQNVGQCTCLECGKDFAVQRHGALYVCERCEADYP